MSGPTGLTASAASSAQLQVEFVSRLANSLGVELVKAEALRSMRERPNNPDAVDLVMRATAKANTTGDNKSINGDVIGLDERALALDPQNERGDGQLVGCFERSRRQSVERRPSGRHRSRGETRRLRFGPSAGRRMGPLGEGAGSRLQTAVESSNIAG